MRLDCHGIIEPLHWAVELALEWTGDSLIEKSAALGVDPGSIAETGLGKMRAHYGHAGIIWGFFESEVRLYFFFVKSGTLDEENAMFFGETRKELLGTLPHEVPAQMAMDNDGISMREYG
jgi:hypothetical protein